jgi:collagenase-like PrtC family protease
MQLGGTGQRIAITNGEEEIEVTIPELIGDFSLNAANAITAYEYLQSGLSRITASYDLSGNAITELASLLGNKSTQLDVVLHTHMPIFHTEHCVFARFLSKGNSYLDCGHVCTRNRVHLRDQNGNDNLVLVGCRNTVFSSESQTGVFRMNDWVRAGVGHFRIELVDESGIDATKIVNSYLQFISKEIQTSEVWDRLKIIPDSNGRLGGVGFGSLRNAAERRSGEHLMFIKQILLCSCLLCLFVSEKTALQYMKMILLQQR